MAYATRGWHFTFGRSLKSIIDCKRYCSCFCFCFIDIPRELLSDSGFYRHVWLISSASCIGRSSQSLSAWKWTSCGHELHGCFLPGLDAWTLSTLHTGHGHRLGLLDWYTSQWCKWRWEYNTAFQKEINLEPSYGNFQVGTDPRSRLLSKVNTIAWQASRQHDSKAEQRHSEFAAEDK